jgi:multiple sugar transport system ATP-binding protein
VLKEDTFALALPDQWKDKLESYADKEVIFGLRPEHVGSPTAESTEGAPKIQASVEVIEPMGSETYLYMNTGTNDFIARVDSHRRCEVGDKLDLAIMLGKAHIFDKETTNLIV